MMKVTVSAPSTPLHIKAIITFLPTGRKFLWTIVETATLDIFPRAIGKY